MNKKILAGFLSAAAVGSFWACGSGEINEPDPMTDGIVELQYMPNGVPDVDKIQSMINEAKDSCAAHAASCGSVYAAYLQEGAKPNQTAPVSSSTGVQEGVGLSSDAIASISSSSRTISYSAPSSSTTIIDDPETPASSASGATEMTGLGTCTAVAADGRTEVKEIAKGVPVKFKVTANNAGSGYNAMDFIKGTYTWNFGATATDDGTGQGPTSGAITFSGSGLIAPSVHVIVGDGAKKPFVEETIKCTPDWVNGESIDGCLCEPAAELVDFSGGATAAWTVTGCASATATIETYEWSAPDGATGTLTGNGAAATYAFTAAEAAVAPTVKVGNSDDAFTTVPCKPVEGSNGPKNNITLPYDKVLEANTVYTVTASCSSTLAFQFSGEGNCNESTCTVSVDGGTGVAVGCYATAPATGGETFSIKSECGIKLSCY